MNRYCLDCKYWEVLDGSEPCGNCVCASNWEERPPEEEEPKNDD